MIAEDRRFRSQAEMLPLDCEALAAYLETVGLRLDRDLPAKQFSSGLANINYFLSVSGQPMVLRRPPDGELPPGAHDMAREHRILARLHQAFPLAPESLHLCTDETVLGVPFQLLEYRDGIVITGDDRSLIDGRPEKARSLGRMLVEVLASIHRVDPDAVGLGDLGRPEGFVQRAVAGWRKRGERLMPSRESAALIAEIAEWLGAQTTRERGARLLHCDFKLGNIILDENSLAANAVVDWDMGTRGDPLFDLATLVSYWTEEDDPPCMHRLAQMPSTAPGFPGREATIELYARSTGEDLSDFPIFRILALFKLAVVFLQLARIHAGQAETAVRQGGFRELGEELLVFTHDIMRGRASVL